MKPGASVVNNVFAIFTNFLLKKMAIFSGVAVTIHFW
jgi:hypothetical protein